ncbi:DUF397 domain-containing protein [Streptomyces roseoverticillatus]|uniref:DUF397 domain-containing protein n=1 Tax=Streptomyces roseoverticillatus TaxID=66429 RepID=UPI000997D175|nr:DUF397 domain-containing protein [Streptomyces roseoverticillatus]
MSTLNWQKSSYSQEASACVHLAVAPSGEVLVHESDAPDVILATTAARLRPLITRIKTRTLSASAPR